MIRRVRINRISPRRFAQLEEYHRTMPVWLRKHRVCEIGPVLQAAGHQVACKKIATHVHHVCGRVGKMLCDQTHWLASCSGECHPSWIHQQHPDIARQLGLLK